MGSPSNLKKRISAGNQQLGSINGNGNGNGPILGGLGLRKTLSSNPGNNVNGN